MKNALLGLSGLALCALLVSGCGGINDMLYGPYDGPKIMPNLTSGVPAPSRSRFRAALDSWQGAHISELLASWGEPNSVSSTSPEGGMWSTYGYQQITNITAGSYSDPMYSKHVSCVVYVMVRPDHSIQDATAKDMYNCAETDPWPSRNEPNRPIRARINSSLGLGY